MRKSKFKIFILFITIIITSISIVNASNDSSNFGLGNKISKSYIEYYSCDNSTKHQISYKDLKSINSSIKKVLNEDYKKYVEYIDYYKSPYNIEHPTRVRAKLNNPENNMTVHIIFTKWYITINYIYTPYRLHLNKFEGLKSRILSAVFKDSLSDCKVSTEADMIIYNTFNYSDTIIDCDKNGINPYLCKDDKMYLNFSKKFELGEGLTPKREHYKDKHDTYFIFNNYAIDDILRIRGIILNKEMPYSVNKKGYMNRFFYNGYLVLKSNTYKNKLEKERNYFHNIKLEVDKNISNLRDDFDGWKFWDISPPNVLNISIFNKRSNLSKTSSKLRNDLLEIQHKDTLASNVFSKQISLLSQSIVNIQNDIDEITNNMRNNIGKFETLYIQKKTYILTFLTGVLGIITGGIYSKRSYQIRYNSKYSILNIYDERNLIIMSLIIGAGMSYGVSKVIEDSTFSIINWLGFTLLLVVAIKITEKSLERRKDKK